jgi:hypothetical protein
LYLNKRNRGILDDCFPNKVNNWLIEAYVGPGYAHKSLKGDNENLIKARNSSENPVVSFNSGLRIGYNYRGGVVKTGFDFTSVNEKFNKVINNQTIITIDTIKNSDGTFTITRDTTYGAVHFNKINSYKYLGIPLILGYELKYKKHSFGLNAGVIINLLLKKKGCIMNKDGEIDDIGASEDLIFRNRTGASLYSSLIYAYSMSDQFAFFVEPRFTYDLFPITNKNYILKQKYFTYGVSFGGRFLF